MAKANRASLPPLHSMAIQKTLFQQLQLWFVLMFSNFGTTSSFHYCRSFWQWTKGVMGLFVPGQTCWREEWDSLCASSFWMLWQTSNWRIGKNGWHSPTRSSIIRYKMWESECHHGMMWPYFLIPLWFHCMVLPNYSYLSFVTQELGTLTHRISTNNICLSRNILSRGLLTRICRRTDWQTDFSPDFPFPNSRII